MEEYNKELIETFSELVKAEQVLPAGDHLLAAVDGKNVEPVAVFVKKKDDENVYLADTFGNILSESTEFHKECIEKSKEMYLKKFEEVSKRLLGRVKKTKQ